MSEGGIPTVQVGEATISSTPPKQLNSRPVRPSTLFLTIEHLDFRAQSTKLEKGVVEHGEKLKIIEKSGNKKCGSQGNVTIKDPENSHAGNFGNGLARNGDPETVIGTTEPFENEGNRRRYLGIALAFFAALMYSFSALTIKLLNYHPMNLGLWRFTAMILITLPFLIPGFYQKRKLPPAEALAPSGIFNEIWWPTKTTAFLMLQAILGSNSILLVFSGLAYLNMGDSIVIASSAPVFVSLASRITLKEPCGVVPVILALLALVGVGIICKPPLITGETLISPGVIQGTSFSFASMILLTFCYVLVRHLRKVHHALNE